MRGLYRELVLVAGWVRCQCETLNREKPGTENWQLKEREGWMMEVWRHKGVQGTSASRRREDQEPREG